MFESPLDGKSREDKTGPNDTAQEPRTRSQNIGDKESLHQRSSRYGKKSFRISGPVERGHASGSGGAQSKRVLGVCLEYPQVYVTGFAFVTQWGHCMR